MREVLAWVHPATTLAAATTLFFVFTTLAFADLVRAPRFTIHSVQNSVRPTEAKPGQASRSNTRWATELLHCLFYLLKTSTSCAACGDPDRYET
jgi:hypothetical protein